MEKTIFKGKYCKVVSDTGFVLYGTVIDIDEQGFFFKTDSQTSYIKWDFIKSIVERC